MSEYNGNSLHVLNLIHSLLEQNSETDLALFLQEPTHVEYLSKLANRCREIRNVYFQNSIDLEFLLRLRCLTVDFDEVYREYERLFIKARNLYDIHFREDWMSKDAISKFLEDRHSCIIVETSEVYLASTNVLARTSKQHTNKAIINIFNVIFGLLAECRDLIHEIEPSCSSLNSAILESYGNYVCEIHSSYLRTMKHEAQAYKEFRSRTLDSRAWEGVLENEENALRLAVGGKLQAAVEVDQKLAPFIHIAEQMQTNYSLVQKIMDISNDEMIFDFDYAFEPHNNISKFLKPENIDLFHQLVLRHDIIRTEMHPSLKEEFLKKYGLVAKQETTIPEAVRVDLNDQSDSSDKIENLIPAQVLAIINEDLSAEEKKDVFKRIKNFKKSASKGVEAELNVLIDNGKLDVEHLSNSEIYKAIHLYLKMQENTFNTLKIHKKKYRKSL